MGYKTVTIKYIAERMRIAPATVRKALKNDQHIKSSIRIRVNKLAQELTYNIRNKSSPPVSHPTGLSARCVTIYDIANQLHLSAATVSRALSSYDRVKNNTIKKVQQLAEILGYTVNSAARQLRIKSASPNQSLSGRGNVTIYTVAKKLNLSPSTVSRAFSAKSKVAPHTQSAILQAASEMGYIAYENARKLRINKIQGH